MLEVDAGGGVEASGGAVVVGGGAVVLVVLGGGAVVVGGGAVVVGFFGFGGAAAVVTAEGMVKVWFSAFSKPMLRMCIRHPRRKTNSMLKIWQSRVKMPRWRCHQ